MCLILTLCFVPLSFVLSLVQKQHIFIETQRFAIMENTSLVKENRWENNTTQHYWGPVIIGREGKSQNNDKEKRKKLSNFHILKNFQWNFQFSWKPMLFSNNFRRRIFHEKLSPFPPKKIYIYFSIVLVSGARWVIDEKCGYFPRSFPLRRQRRKKKKTENYADFVMIPLCWYYVFSPQ